VIKPIFKTTLIAGTLDIIAACIHSYITNGTLPSTVFKYIASGIFGPQAFSGGIGMIAIGLLVHYFIAFACTACFFWLYPKWSFLRINLLLNSVLIGVTAWIVTTRIIVPLSKVGQGSFDLSRAFVALLILIVCIGTPIAYNARQYYAHVDQ
jgi:hypothetical protein